MARLSPFFLTGANAKIIVNGVTIALATDVSYKITVRHGSPRVLGMYEPQEHTPLSYDVSGNFSIIRYLGGLKELVEKEGYKSPVGVSNEGNGLGRWHVAKGDGALAEVLNLPNFKTGGTDGRAQEAFIPRRMYQSMMFDIEIRQTAPNGEEGTVVRFRNCRIEETQFNMSKKSPATQSFVFKAIHADEDSFIAAGSGVGQSLT